MSIGTSADDKGTEQDATVLEAATRFEGLLGGTEKSTAKPGVDADRTGGEKVADDAKAAEGEEAQPDTKAPPEEGAVESYEIDGPDGQKVTVSFDDLVQGYLRAQAPADTADLESRQAELDRQEGESRAAWQQRLQQADEYFQFLMDTDPVLAQARTADWEKLANEDPDAYNRLQAGVQTRTRKLEQWKAQRAKAADEAMQQTIAREAKLLAEKLPIAKDRAKWEPEAKALGEYLVSSGYRAEDLRNLADHRAVVIAHKAMLYDRLQASKAETAKKVVAVPRLVKPGTKPAAKVDEARDRRTQLATRVKQTGKVDDAARYFLDTI